MNNSYYRFIYTGRRRHGDLCESIYRVSGDLKVHYWSAGKGEWCPSGCQTYSSLMIEASHDYKTVEYATEEEALADLVMVELTS